MKKLLLIAASAVFIMCTSTLMAQQKNVFSYKVGDFTVSTLSEGQQNGNTSILIDASKEMLQKYAPNGIFPNAVNAFLVQTPDKTILVDAGFGRNLFDNIKSLGSSAEKVDIILLTHMHGDHIGGLLKDGNVTFPNAEIYIPQPEHDYWKGNNGKSQIAVIEAYKSKLHLFTPSELGKALAEILPGIKTVAAYGHTPGHTGYLVESKGDKLLIWGDLTHAMAVQMPHPEIAVTYDVDPKMATESRKKVLEYVAKNKIPIAGMHIAFPAMGNIKPDDKGYSFNPLK